MKKVAIALFLIIVAAVLVVLALAASKPDTYSVERSATIAAQPEQVFAYVNDFHQWPQWSPWEKLDPKMNRTYGGPASGQGSTYGWVGNNDVGEGRMTITESVPGSKVGIQLEFLKPMAATSQTTFDFVPSGAGTQVVWKMTGKNDLMSKVFTVFMNMDQMIGKDFESGLANLKQVAEGAAPADTTRPDTLTTSIP